MKREQVNFLYARRAICRDADMNIVCLHQFRDFSAIASGECDDGHIENMAEE